MTNAIQINTSRRSANWSSIPGNFDKLNTRMLLPGDNDWGIPDLPFADYVPEALIAYNQTRVESVAGITAVHYFLDDYRFETTWSRPEQSLSRVGRTGLTLSPDYSLWREMPKAMQIWQVYRNRWCGAWAALNGIKVIPTVSWSTPDTYPFAFSGIERGSVVAISTVGIIRNKDIWPAFFSGYDAMMETIEPSVVLCYGKPLPVMAGDVREYPTRWR